MSQSIAKFCPHSPLVPELLNGQPTGRLARLGCDPFACEIMESCKGEYSPKAIAQRNEKAQHDILDELLILKDRLGHFEKRLEDGISALRAFAPKLKDLPVVGASLSRLFGG